MSTTENGVEVCLYPDSVLSAIKHTDRIAIDFGGKPVNNWLAPCRLKVVKRTDNYNGVIFWSTEPVLTPSGKMDITLWLMHDNDISDLNVGRIIEQGQPFYQEGGWGANGATTYANHIHCNCAIGHTTAGHTTSQGKYELNGSVWANDVFFLKGNETIINTGGMKWTTYAWKSIAHLSPAIAHSSVDITGQAQITPIIERIAQTSPIDGRITMEVIGTVALTEPIQETKPIDELVIEETPNKAPQAPNQPIEHCEPVQPRQTKVKSIWVIILELILTIFKGK